MNEDKETDFHDTRGCFALFVHTESRAHEWECGHARDKRGASVAVSSEGSLGWEDEGDEVEIYEEVREPGR
jgi:hypothetical protein